MLQPASATYGVGTHGCAQSTAVRRLTGHLDCAVSVAPQESLVSPIDRRSDFYRQQARHIAHPTPERQPLMTIPNVLTFFR